MKTSPKPTYWSLQAGRGVAALMVVIFHTTSFLGGDSRYWHQTWLTVRLAGFALGVEYFFVLSGAVIFIAHAKDIGQVRLLPAYLLKRFRRLYPIYWLVLAVVVLSYVCRPAVGAKWETDKDVILSGICLLNLDSAKLNLPVAWTLFHEVLFYIVFGALLVNRQLGAVILTLWAALSLAMLAHPINSLYLSTYLFSPLHLLFCLGIVSAWIIKNYQIQYPTAIALTGVVTVVLAVTAAGKTGGISSFTELLSGLGASMVIIGGVHREEMNRLSVPTLLRLCGDASYSIYLIHFPLFSFLAPYLYRVSLYTHAPLLLPFLSLILMAVTGGCLLHRWVERPILKAITPKRNTL